MHIGFVTPEYVTESNFDGGLANYLHRTTHALAERGHWVDLFVISGSGQDEVFSDGEVVVHRVRVRNPHWVAFWRQLPRRLQMPLICSHLLQSWCLSKAIRDWHKKEPFDVIQSTNVGLAGFFLSFRCPFPVITRISCHMPTWRSAYKWPPSRQQTLFERLEAFAVKRTDVVFAPSHLLASIWEHEERVSCEVCEPPFSLDDLTQPSADFTTEGLPERYILFFGTLGLLKGVDILARALSPVMEKHADVELVLVGKDVGYGNMSMLRYVLDSAGPYRWHVRYGGVLGHQELEPVISNATVVVLPSRIDNLPNTCLEAMARRRVVVASTNASFDELIEHGKSGFLFKNEDVQSLSKTLSGALNLPEKTLRKIGSAARRRIEKLSPENTIPHLEDLYEQAISSFQSHKRAKSSSASIQFQHRWQTKGK